MATPDELERGPVDSLQDYGAKARDAAASYLDRKKQTAEQAAMRLLGSSDTAREIFNQQLPQAQMLGLAPLDVKPIDKPSSSTPMVPASGGGVVGTDRIPQGPIVVSAPMMGEQSSSSGTSVEKGVRFSPEVAGLQERGFGEQRSGNTLKAATEIQTRKDQEDFDKRSNLYQGAQQVEENIARIPEEHAVAAEHQKLKNLVSDYSSAKVDPKHFAKSTNLGEKLAWAVAMAAGGFAAGLRGGTNSAAELWQKAVDNDISAQKSNIDMMGNRVTNERSLLGDMQKRFSDAREQRLAARVAALQAFKTKLGSQYDGTKDAATKANLQLELAKADELQSKDMAELQKSQSDRVTSHFTATNTAKPNIEQQRVDADAIRDYSHQLATADIPGTQAIAQKTLETMPANGHGVGIVGDALWNKSPATYRAVYGDGAVAYQQNRTALRNQLYHTLSGAAVGPKEEERLIGAFDAAHDPGSQQRAVQNVLDIAAAKQAAAGGALTPEQKAEYDANARANANPVQQVAPQGLPKFAIPAGGQ